MKVGKIIGLLLLWGFTALIVGAAIRTHDDYTTFRVLSARGQAVVVGVDDQGLARLELVGGPHAGKTLTASSPSASQGTERGQRVPVLYNPKAPQKAVLAAEWSPMSRGLMQFMWGFAGIMTAIALLVTWLALRRGETSDAKKQTKEPS